MDHSIRLIVDSEGKVPGGGHEPDGVTIKLNGSDKLEAQTMVGATSTADGKRGIVPAPVAGDEEKFLSGDGTWKTAGEHLYQHTYHLRTTYDGKTTDFTSVIYTNSETCVETATGLFRWLKDNGYTSSSNLYQASGGTYTSSSNAVPVTGI